MHLYSHSHGLYMGVAVGALFFRTSSAKTRKFLANGSAVVFAKDSGNRRKGKRFCTLNSDAWIPGFISYLVVAHAVRGFFGFVGFE